MERSIKIPLETYKRLCGCLVESQEILESLGVWEFKKTPKLSKAKKTEMRLEKLLKTGYQGKNK